MRLLRRRLPPPLPPIITALRAPLPARDLAVKFVGSLILHRGIAYPYALLLESSCLLACGSERVLEGRLLARVAPQHEGGRVPERVALQLHGVDHVLEELDEAAVVGPEDGALVEDDGKLLVLDMGDSSLPIRFVRNTKAGKFARFVVRSDNA